MPTTTTEAGLTAVLTTFLPTDYSARSITPLFIEELLKKGLAIGPVNASVDLIRGEGYQQGQLAARQHFAEMAFEGIEAHQIQFDEASGDILCSCGTWKPSNKRKGNKEPDPDRVQWRHHAAAALAGLTK